MEEKPDNRPLLPPNYVSLRQLRERRLKEMQEKETEEVRESDGRARFPPIYAPPLWQLKEEKEREKGREGEKETDQCACVPPNYVSLRQLKEEQEKKKGKGREEESESHFFLPANYISLRQLREQRLREEKEREKENEEEIDEEKMKMKMKEKAKDEEEEKGVPPNCTSLRQLKELRLEEKVEKEAEEEAQKARVRQIKAREKGDESRQIKVKINENAHNRARNLQSKKSDKLGNMESGWVWQPVLPPVVARTNSGISSANSVFQSENAGVSHEVMMVSVLQNGDYEMKHKNKTTNKKKGWKKQKERPSRETTSGKNKGEALESPELPMEVTDLKGGEISATKDVALSQNAGVSHEVMIVSVLQNGDYEMKPKNKTNNKKKKGWKKQKERPSRETTSAKNKGEALEGSELPMEVTDLKGGEISTANDVALSQNAGVSHEVMMVSVLQNGDYEMKSKNKTNKKKKKGRKERKERPSRETTSGKNKGEALEGSELPMEVTDLKGGEISATKEVASSQNEIDTVKGKEEEKVNLTKSSGQSIPVCLEMKGFNGARSMGSRKHNSRDKWKGKEINLLESRHNVVPVSNVAKVSDALEEVTGFKIKYGKDHKGKGEMGNISQSSDQTPCHEEAKGVHGAGEVIGSEIQSGEEKGRGKNVNLPESSKWGDQVGASWMRRNQAAWFRGMGQQGTGRSTMGPAEHQRTGGLVWVPKKNS